jgi:hypothetical protein
MNATTLLHNLGQSLWLDNITRDVLNTGTLKRYIDELSVTGLTSNPTIFDHAIKTSSAYDSEIRERPAKSGERLFFELAACVPSELQRRLKSFKGSLASSQTVSWRLPKNCSRENPQNHSPRKHTNTLKSLVEPSTEMLEVAKPKAAESSLRPTPVGEQQKAQAPVSVPRPLAFAGYRHWGLNE